MFREVLLYFGILFCTIKGWEERTLSHLSRALCSDGSPGRYLFDTFQHSSEWLLFLPGGAACNNAQMCEHRSSKYPWLVSSSLENGECCNQAAIFNRDCDKNPLFCKANHIYITYCSSDLWSGDSQISLQDGRPFYFRGAPILYGVIESLLPYLEEASVLYLSGNSAGGMASFIHADRIHNYLASKLKRVLPIKAIIDSAIFQPDPVFRPLECFLTLQCGAQKSWKQGLKIWNALLDQSCIQDNRTQVWKCLSGINAIKYVSVPVFILMHKNDPFQPIIDGISKRKSTSAQNDYLAKRRQEMFTGLVELYESGASLFLTDCEFHTILLFEEQYLENEVKGMTAAKALYEWARQEKHLFVRGGEAQVCSDSETVFDKHRAIFGMNKPIQ